MWVIHHPVVFVSAAGGNTLPPSLGTDKWKRGWCVGCTPPRYHRRYPVNLSTPAGSSRCHCPHCLHPRPHSPPRALVGYCRWVSGVAAFVDGDMACGWLSMAVTWHGLLMKWPGLMWQGVVDADGAAGVGCVRGTHGGLLS